MPQPDHESTTAIATPATHEVVHEESGRFEVPDGEIVLDAALAARCMLDHGCRAGSCGSCAVEVLEGLMHVADPDCIEAEALAHFQLGPAARLACRMRAKGPLRLRRI